MKRLIIIMLAVVSGMLIQAQSWYENGIEYKTKGNDEFHLEYEGTIYAGIEYTISKTLTGENDEVVVLFKITDYHLEPAKKYIALFKFSNGHIVTMEDIDLIIPISCTFLPTSKLSGSDFENLLNQYNLVKIRIHNKSTGKNVDLYPEEYSSINYRLKYKSIERETYQKVKSSSLKGATEGF